jgi:hypothetical protein
MTYTKLLLSGSINGRQIPINSITSASAVPIHTAVTGSSALDEIWLYAYNDSTSSLQVSVLWGAVTESNDVVRTTLLSKSGRILITDGKLLQNGLTVQAYAQMANAIVMDGFVNRAM